MILKKPIIKLIVFSVAFLTMTSTLYSQPILTDDKKEKCFTYEQAKQIFIDLKKGELCDSISQNQALQIINFKEVVKKDLELDALNKKFIADQGKEINTANLKLKISKRLTFVGVPVALVGGFIFGVLIK